MTDLELLGNYDFGVYTIPEGYAVADPLADEEGFYLTGDNLSSLCAEAIDSQCLRPID